MLLLKKYLQNAFQRVKKYCLQQEQTVQAPREAIHNAQIPLIQQSSFVCRFQTYTQTQALVKLVWDASTARKVQFSTRLPRHCCLLSP